MNNKSQEKHTALPWHVPFSHPTIVHNSVGQCIADCDSNIYIGFAEKEFNAQFIVQAVNCHADLLEACKVALEAMKWQQKALAERGEPVLVGLGMAMQQCDKAIEKASAQ